MYTFNLNMQEVLEKLGSAIYLHKELIKTAHKGKQAVEYLEKEGVFKTKEKTPVAYQTFFNKL